KADSAAAPVTGGDAAVDLPEAAEQCSRIARFAGLQQLADMGRRIDCRILAADRSEHGHPEAVLQTGGAQGFRRSAAAVAKGAIPADHDMRGPDRSDDHFGNEFLGTLLREGEVEMLDEQQIDAESGQFTLLDAERRQPEGFGRGEEHAARMRLEGQHSGGAARFPRELAGPAGQPGMAAMQTIEIAHRQDRAGRVVRPGAGMSDDSDHGSGNRAVSRPANCYENSPAGGQRIAYHFRPAAGCESRYNRRRIPAGWTINRKPPDETRSERRRRAIARGLVLCAAKPPSAAPGGGGEGDARRADPDRPRRSRHALRAA